MCLQSFLSCTAVELSPILLVVSCCFITRYPLLTLFLPSRSFSQNMVLAYSTVGRKILKMLIAIHGGKRCCTNSVSHHLVSLLTRLETCLGHSVSIPIGWYCCKSLWPGSQKSVQMFILLPFPTSQQQSSFKTERAPTIPLHVNEGLGPT